VGRRLGLYRDARERGAPRGVFEPCLPPLIDLHAQGKRLREAAERKEHDADGGASDVSDEEVIEEELGFISPLDTVNPYVRFKQALASTLPPPLYPHVTASLLTAAGSTRGEGSRGVPGSDDLSQCRTANAAYGNYADRGGGGYDWRGGRSCGRIVDVGRRLVLATLLRGLRSSLFCFVISLAFPYIA
jgi:hypothetical protein